MRGVRIKTPSFVDCLPHLDAIAATVDPDRSETLWEAVSQYLAFCKNSGMLISNRTLYLALGCSKETICTWANGTRRQHNPEYRQFAIFVKQLCAAAREQYGLEGIVNPILTIFHQKAWDGFTDTPQIMDIRDPLGDLPDGKNLAKKWGMLDD